MGFTTLEPGLMNLVVVYESSLDIQKRNNSCAEKHFINHHTKSRFFLGGMNHLKMGGLHNWFTHVISVFNSNQPSAEKPQI